MMTRSKTYIFSAIVAIFLTVGVVWYVAGDRSPESSETLGFEAIPAWSFSLSDEQGTVHRIEDLKSKIILLHFWASWCEPCLDEIPIMYEYASAFAPEDLLLVTVTLDTNWEDANKVTSDLEKPPSILTLIDPEGEVANRYGAFQYPETFLINPERKILTKWVGPQNWEDPQLKSWMTKLISDSKN